MKYQILTAQCPKALATQVDAALAAGWVLQGGVAISHGLRVLGEDDARQYLAQAMTLAEVPAPPQSRRR